MHEHLSFPCVAGVEHELATISFDSSNHRIAFRAEHQELMNLARARHPYLPGRRGIFFGNSLNLYEDASSGGAHLEIATGECSSPAELVAHSEAGHRLIQSLLAEYISSGGARSASLHRHSFDYLTKASWATHLSVLSALRPSQIQEDIAAHLVSKMVYAGSGGFVPQSSEPLFCLAPRLRTFTCVNSGGQTQTDRGLIGGDKEHHCPHGLIRQHFLCHENLCLSLPKYLDVGSAMLILRMLDAGHAPGVRLKQPIAALHDFAADPSCTTKVALEGGRRLTAVEIQRCYLNLAQDLLGSAWMPSWAAEFCRIWSQTLTLIESGAPHSVSDRLDWAAKFVIFCQHADSKHGGSWSACHEQLFELDMRWGHAGTGICDQLVAAGALDGQVPGAGAEEVASARTKPPQETRAKLRGEWIQEMHQKRVQGHASWTWVEDARNQLVLELKDPWGRGAAWRRLQQVDPVDDPIATAIRFEAARRTRLLSASLRDYERGEFRSAFQSTSRLLAEPGLLTASQERLSRQCHLCAAARLGLDEVHPALERLEATCQGRTAEVIAHALYAHRALHLVPESPEALDWIARAEQLAAEGAGQRDPVLIIDLAGCMNRLGHPDKAFSLLGTVSARPPSDPRQLARASAEKGEALRLLCQFELAENALREAYVLQDGRYLGDLADFTLTYRAKLLGGAAGRELLQQATAIQRSAETPVAELRSVLLDARLAGKADDYTSGLRERAVQLRARSRVISRDSTASLILGHWDQWVSGQPEPDGNGDAFWRI